MCKGNYDICGLGVKLLIGPKKLLLGPKKKNSDINETGHSRSKKIVFS